MQIKNRFKRQSFILQTCKTSNVSNGRFQKRLGIKEDKNLYTDENPKGTIHGLGFTDGETARKSVSKIKKLW